MNVAVKDTDDWRKRAPEQPARTLLWWRRNQRERRQRREYRLWNYVFGKLGYQQAVAWETEQHSDASGREIRLTKIILRD